MSLPFHIISDQNINVQSIFSVGRFAGGVRHKHENLGIFIIRWHYWFCIQMSLPKGTLVSFHMSLSSRKMKTVNLSIMHGD